MKRDKAIEKWFKERSDRELSPLLTLAKDEQGKKTLLMSAFHWTVNECPDLKILENQYPLSPKETTDEILLKQKNISSAQIDSILKYRKSGVCVRCKKTFGGIIKEFNKKHKINAPLADYLFVSIHEFTGLCADCIGDFLLGFVTKLN